ncbi:preprotein translocase subunit SecG [Endozoicomonadaceae bacterium StTr2]
METVVLIVHVLVALAVIGLVLIQQGKGADTGASFGGGASQTVFGSSGSTSFLARLTSVLAIVFFVTSFGLAFFAKYQAEGSADLGVPAVVEQQSEAPAVAPVDSDAPVLGNAVESGESTTAGDVPVLDSSTDSEGDSGAASNTSGE